MKYFSGAAIPALLGIYWLANFVAEHGRQILITAAVIAAVIGTVAVYRTVSWRYWNVGTVTSLNRGMPVAGRRPVAVHR